MTPVAAYSYKPAYKRYGPNIAVIHFAGGDKPWNYERFFDGGKKRHKKKMKFSSFHFLTLFLFHLQCFR